MILEKLMMNQNIKLVLIGMYVVGVAAVFSVAPAQALWPGIDIDLKPKFGISRPLHSDIGLQSRVVPRQ